MGAILCQLGESEEEMAVTVELDFRADFEPDGNGEVTQIFEECACR